ncbi:MAG: hypothetical protein SchgKO_01990 [Schleiferiaceae bacterium]
MKRINYLYFLCYIAFLAMSNSMFGQNQNPWINEFHYDNVGADTLEFVEVVIPQSDSALWATLELSIYNGSTGKVTSTSKVSTWSAGDTVNGFAFFFTWIKIQNGPEALCLADTGEVYHLLFFESSFTLVSGPALGLVGGVLPVSETNSSPIGQSLGLSGSGSALSHFSWNVLNPSTPGGLNSGQSTIGCSIPAIPTLSESLSHSLGFVFTPGGSTCSPLYYLAGSTLGFPSIADTAIDSLGLSNTWRGNLQGTGIGFLDTSTSSFSLYDIPEDSLIYFTLLAVNEYGVGAPLTFTKTRMSYDSLWITEIMYNPKGGAIDESKREWVELYNASRDTLDLKGWSLHSGTDSYDFSDSLRYLPPEHFLVVGLSTDTSENGSAPVDLEYSSNFRLNNTEDSLFLLDPLYKPHFELRYAASTGWPSCPDGYSLVWDFFSNPSLSSSWGVSVLDGGSPGSAAFEYRFCRQRWYPKVPTNKSTDTLWIADYLELDTLNAGAVTLHSDTLSVLPRGLLRVDSILNKGVVWLKGSSLGQAQARGNNFSENGTVLFDVVFNNPGWKMISVPLAGCSFEYPSTQASLQFNTHPNGPNIYFWNSKTGNWQAPLNSSSKADSCGFIMYLDSSFTQGISTWPKTITFKGAQWKTVTETLPSHYNNGTGWGGGYANQITDGWVLWHNPYPSQIHWPSLSASSGGLIGSHYYIWNDPVNSWEFSDGQLGTPNVSSQIASGQSFFVRVVDTTAGAAFIDASMSSIDSLQLSLKNKQCENNNLSYVKLVFDSLGHAPEVVYLVHKPGKTSVFEPSNDGVTPADEWALLSPSSADSVACSVLNVDFTSLVKAAFRKHSGEGWKVTSTTRGASSWLLVFGADSCVGLENGKTISLGEVPPLFLQNYAPTTLSGSTWDSPFLQTTKEKIKSVEIFSMSGQLVVTDSESLSNSLHGLKSGVYLVKAVTEEGRILTQKVVVP